MKVFIKAEDMRDRAGAVYPLRNGTELVLSMTCGYSDLFIRNTATKEIIKELYFEEPNRKEINKYCLEKYGVEFVTI